MAYNIFISSDGKDADLARDLSKRLMKAGLTATTSPNKTDRDRIENLKKADEVIFLLTTNSLESYNVFFDMGAAYEMNKRLAPVLVGVRVKDLSAIVKGLDFIKYDELERYISKLQRRVKKSSKSSAQAQQKLGETAKSAA
jgi:TIR domain-containing protein